MSCEVTSTRLEIVQGDTAVLQLTITKADCVTPEDLTPFSKIYFTIKRSAQDPDSAALFRGTLDDGDIDVLDAEAGSIEVTVPPSVTSLIRFGKPFYWDCQIESDSDNLYTPKYGTIHAVNQTTRST
jgi:hypothetical protein